MRTRLVAIYQLRCPSTGDVRYIGATLNPRHRLTEHLRHSQTDGLEEWIGGLDAPPVLEVVMFATEAERDAVEAAAILAGFEAGYPLLNRQTTVNGCPWFPPEWDEEAHRLAVQRFSALVDGGAAT